MEKTDLEKKEIKKELPYTVESVPVKDIPKAEIREGNKLFVGGQEQGQYGTVMNLGRQKNDPNLIHFLGLKEGEEKRTFKVIDIANPDKELLGVTIDEKENTLVNGYPWESLKGKEIYFGGYKVELDPDGGNIVFRETKHEGSSVIVNNSVWKTKFEGSIQFATSRFGTAYAVGADKLVIEDKEWNYNKFVEGEGYNRREDKIKDAVVGKTGKVAAVADSLRTGDRREHVLVGDTAGEKYAWENTLWKTQKLVIDDQTDRVAAYGDIERDSNKKRLIVDDIAYDLPTSPKDLEYLGFEGGNVVIQYIDQLGKKKAETIKLKEDAKELQKIRDKERKIDEAMVLFRKKVAEEGLSIEDAVSRVKESEKLSEENKSLKEKLDFSTEERIKLEESLREKEEDLKKEKKSTSELINDLKKGNTALEEKMSEIKKIIDKVGKGFLGGYKLSSEEMNKIREILGEI